jgi:hypothetical protein
MPLPRCRTALTIAALLLAAAPTASAQTPLTPPGNTGLAGEVRELTDHRLLMRLSEAETGADLNGDGDQDDQVPHLEIRGAGTDMTVPVAGFWSGFAFDARWLLASGQEFNHGSDLNGDGDQVDQVLSSLDSRTGTMVNTGLSGFPTMDGPRALIGVLESATGQDLNGDNDSDDTILHVRDLETGTTTNLGLAQYPFMFPQLHDRSVFVVIDEFATSIDLDGDGVPNELLVHRYDWDTGTVTRMSDFSIAIAPWLVVDDTLVMGLTESEIGFDVNMDGNTLGTVLALMDPATGTIRLTDVVFLLGAATFGGDGSVYAAFRPAGANPQIIAHRVDLATGLSQALSNLPLGTSPPDFRTPLADDTHADLNGDGDTDDMVLHTLELATGTARNHGFAVQIDSLDIRDGIATALVSEQAQGAADRNGDGDLLDGTPIAIDVATGRRLEFRSAASKPIPSETLVVFSVLEAENGGRDANGDGDVDDEVVHVYDMRRRQLFPLGVNDGFVLVTNRSLAFRVPEIGSGLGDLNNDGDAADGVVHIVRF